MMKPSKKEAFTLLQKMAYVRQAGSKEEHKAAKLLQKTCEDAGVKAEIEAFAITDGKGQKAKLEVLSPYKKRYTVTAYKCCAATPPEGLEAELYYAESLGAVDLARVKGKIVLLGDYLRLPAYKKLVQAGAAGFITLSGSMLDKPEESDLFTRMLREPLRRFGALPGVNLRVGDAFELVEKRALKLRLTVSGETVEKTSHNVVATIPGTKLPDEILSFGAHYDSTEFSTGVYDNGAGSVINMELLKYFAKNPPLRTLKFMWYGSEEIGLEGSKAYVRDHAEELKNHRLMVNVDVGGPVLGHNSCTVTASKELAAFTDMYFKVKGYPFKVTAGIYSSDSIPFADAGVPAVNFSRDAIPGAAFIHSRNDVMAYLSPEGLGQLLAPVFAYARLLAGAEAFPEKREIPEDIRKEVDKYLFKKELEGTGSPKKDAECVLPAQKAEIKA